MDGFAGFRHGQDYELDIGESDADDERPAEVVIINPVSKLWMYFSKSDFGVMWEKKR